MNPAALQHRRKWLMMLAPLVSPSFPEQAADALVAMLPLLQDFPDAAFSLGSLEAVASVRRRQATPALDELRHALGAWWRENNLTPRLPAPPNSGLPADRPPPTQAEVEAVAVTLTAWRDESRAGAEGQVQETRPEPRHLPDEALLERYEDAARQAGPGQEAAAFRAEALRRKLGLAAA